MKLSSEEKKAALALAEKLTDKFSVKKTLEFIKTHQNLSFIDDVKILFDMITDKEYKIDKKTFAVIAGALAYLVLPTDIIPDFIPGVGFVDDAYVIATVIKRLKSEIDNYKRFKSEGGS